MTAIPECDSDCVTVISPTASDNALLRSEAVIRLLRYRFRVQHIAFDREGRIYPPLAASEVARPLHYYYAKTVAGWAQAVNRLASEVRGKAIVCIKPKLGSFGAGLLLGRRLKRPVVVDVDDWELGFLPTSSLDWEMRFYKLRWLTRTASPLYLRLLDGRVNHAAAVTVSNSFLQGMYGGHWIPHARDLGLFRESPYPVGTRRVIFTGKPRAHKGLATLLKAWRHVGNNAVLQLVVPDPAEDLRGIDLGGLRVEITGPHCTTEIPGLLSAASVVVVPQENARGALGQLPMKMLDGMAAARPVVASDVCDAARWLADGAGIVVQPGCPEALSQAISGLLADPERAEAMGLRARERLLELASEPSVAKRYCDVVDAVCRGESIQPTPAFGQSEA